jgi:hypothetical protein
MATTDKDQMIEEVNQHKRLAVGAWIDGESLPQQGSATMPKANSDHGNITGSIDIKNA